MRIGFWGKLYTAIGISTTEIMRNPQESHSAVISAYNKGLYGSIHSGFNTLCFSFRSLIVGPPKKHISKN